MEKKIERTIHVVITVKSRSERTTAEAIEVAQEAIDRMAWDNEVRASVEIRLSQDKVI